MKKYNSLNEQINRMKSLMTEERLHGNLVDGIVVYENRIITEGVGSIISKHLDTLIKGTKLDNTIKNKYTKLATEAGYAGDITKMFDDFKNISVNGKKVVKSEDFINYWGKFKPIWDDILKLAGYTTEDIERAEDVILLLGKKHDIVDEAGKTVEVYWNAFDPMKPGTEDYFFKLIPEEGGLRLNAMESYKNTIGPEKFKEYLKKTEKIYSDVIPNVGGKVAQAKAGTLKGAYIVDAQTVKNIIDQDIYRMPKNKIVITDPKEFEKVLSAGASKEMKEGRILGIVDADTGEVILVNAASTNTVEYLTKIMADNLSKSEKGKGWLPWLNQIRKGEIGPTLGKGGKLDIRIWGEDRIIQNLIDRKFTTIGPKQVAGQRFNKVATFVTIDAVFCHLMSRALGEDSMIYWCNPLYWGEKIGESLGRLTKGVLDVIDSMICGRINDNFGDGTCQEYKDKVKSELESLKDINCDSIPADAKVNEESLSQWVTEEYIRRINKVSKEMGIDTLSEFRDFIARLKSEYGNESEEVKKIADNLAGKCISESNKNSAEGGGGSEEGAEIYVPVSTEGSGWDVYGKNPNNGDN